MVEMRLGEICEGTGLAMGVEIFLDFQAGYPATANDPDKAAFAADVACDLIGAEKVDRDVTPLMAAEDFAYMVQERPGAYLVLGQGDGPFVHHPAYDFNDEIAPLGASFLARLVERALPVGG